MKRFYREVAVVPAGGGWQVTLDARGVKTAMGKPQIVPARPLAEALAAEWADQGEDIAPASLVLRDMADHALDIVASDRAAAIANLVRYAETDTLCYRAEPDDALHARQLEVWEPLLRAAETRWDVHFARVHGVLHRPQSPATLARLEQVLLAEGEFTLAALTTLASLAASLVIGLAALAPDANAQALWCAANLEEDWQAKLWGKDAEAEALRARRLATFEAAARFAALASKTG